MPHRAFKAVAPNRFSVQGRTPGEQSELRIRGFLDPGGSEPRPEGRLKGAGSFWILGSVLIVVGWIALGLVVGSLVGCAGSGSSIDAVAAKLNQVAADGVVSPAELRELVDLINREAGRPDWIATATTAAVGLASTFFGIRVVRRGTIQAVVPQVEAVAARAEEAHRRLDQSREQGP